MYGWSSLSFQDVTYRNNDIFVMKETTCLLLQNTYFYQIYPQNLIGEVDYVIIPEAGDDYNQEGMENFLKELQHNPKYQVEKISRLQESNLALYKVCSKTNQ